MPPGDLPPDSSAPARLNLGEVKSIFLRWEKLRPIYNLAVAAILIGAYFVLVPIDQQSTAQWLGFLAVCLLGGILANLCYFAGPLADLYFAWLQWRTRWTTAVLLVLGVVVTCLLSVLWFAAVGASVFLFFAR